MGLAVSCFSEDFSDSIVIGIGYVCKTSFGIRCGFLRQLRALGVRAVICTKCLFGLLLIKPY